MLGLNLAGIRFPCDSLPVLTLFASAAIVGALFVLRLITAPEPLIPIAILLDPVVRCSFIANALGWASIVGLNIFLPSYLQSVAALTPTESGLALMVLMVTLNISAGLSSGIVCRMRHYKTLPIAGLVIAVAAVLILAWQAAQIDLWRFETLLILIGAGFGPLPSLTQVTLQNAVPRHQLGISLGAMNFFRGLSGAILVAAFGAIVLQGGTPGGAGMAQAGAAQAYAAVFLADAACIAIALIALLLMAERPLKDEP
jgi:sugar phosphate permease